jgi:hypothetical protein
MAEMTEPYSDTNKRYPDAIWQSRSFEILVELETWSTDQQITHIDWVDGWRPLEMADA